MCPLETYGIQSSTGYLQGFVAIKGEDELRTNTAVLVQDKDLIVPIGPSQIMIWRALLITGGNSPGNVDYQWVTPAAPVSGTYSYKLVDAAAALQDGVSANVALGYNALFNLLANGAGLEFAHTYEGRLVNGANGGYFSFNWAQNVANLVASKLLKGSRIEAWIL